MSIDGISDDYYQRLRKVSLEIAAEHGTPFYLFESRKFSENIDNFRKALDKYIPNNIVGYSFKTNCTPSICAAAKKKGCFAEVVSGVELELAERLGFEQGKVIFNGPVKTLADIERAISLGAIVNFDNVEQVESLQGLDQSPLQKLKAGLRINIDLNQTLNSKKIAKGGVYPRFGLHGKELQASVEKLAQLELPIVSLHGHCSSSDRAPENYTAILKELLSVRDLYDLNEVEYLDVGGGFSGSLPTVWGVADSPTFDDYAEAIYSPLRDDKWYTSRLPNIVIEPGMSVVGDAVCLVTGIVSEKTIDENKIIGVDGTFYQVRPTYHSKPLTNHLIKVSSSGEPETKRVHAVVGATCMERDILLSEVDLKNPLVGDLLLIEDVGAYCSVLTPNFICYQPPIIHLDDSFDYSVSRRAQTFDSFFADFDFTIQ